MKLKSSIALVPHKNVPGYARLPTEVADTSGTLNADPQFMADRLAILNHVHAYAYLIDERRWDEWYELFSDDVVFEATLPLLSMVRANDKEALREANGIRYVEPGKNSTAVRRHTMGNIHVAEQTENAAKVRKYMFISNVPCGDKVNGAKSTPRGRGFAFCPLEGGRTASCCWSLTGGNCQSALPLWHNLYATPSYLNTNDDSDEGAKNLLSGRAKEL